MPHIPPRQRTDLAEFEELFARGEGGRGYVPSSLFMMAWRPRMMQAVSDLVTTTMSEGEVDRGLKFMVAQVSSQSGGCMYCQAHTATGAAHAGVDTEKVAALYEFEQSPHFSDAERAALRLGRDAGIIPNAVTKEHFDDLRRHFSEVEIVELMGTVALFGFLNRWNDSFATELEDIPRAFAEEHLGARGWTVGKHSS